MIEYWANNQPRNIRYKNKNLKEYYSETPCYREVHGTLHGVPGKYPQYLYLKTNMGLGTFNDLAHQADGDNIRWSHEELRHLQEDYCSYTFWGVWHHNGDPGPGFQTIGGQIGSGWWYNDNYSLPYLDWTNIIHEGIRQLHHWTWAYNYINTHVLSRETIDIFTID